MTTTSTTKGTTLPPTLRLACRPSMSELPKFGRQLEKTFTDYIFDVIMDTGILLNATLLAVYNLCFVTESILILYKENPEPTLIDGHHRTL